MQTTATTQTNLVLNPSFETGITSWFKLTGSETSITQTSAQKFTGTYSCAVVTNASSQGIASQITGISSSSIYTFSIYVLFPVGVAGTVQMDEFNSSTYVTSDAVGFTGTGSWQRVSVTATTSATTNTLNVMVKSQAATTFYVDAAMLQSGSTPTPYFDGSFGTGYTWSGTVNNSPSFYNQFVAASASNSRTLNNGVLISWDKTVASSSNFFTIGTSTIGGGDIIKSAGASPVFSDQYNYKDYSHYVTDWSITKNLGQYPYGIMMSQAQINLNNATGIFTPASGSAIGMNVKTGRPVKISVGFNNETIYQFVGYTDTPQYDAGNDTVSLHCFDAVDYLNSFVSELSTQLNLKADAIIALLLEEAGFATNQFVLEPSLQPTIAVFSGQGETIGTLIQNLCEAEAGLFFCDELGILHFWNREHFANITTPQFTFNYSNTSTFTDQDTPIINYVEISSSPLSLSTNQSLYTTTTPQVIAGIGPNGSNNIANPSFETSTSGWTGDMVRVNTAANVGSWSASGKTMSYDISSVLSPSADGIGLTGTAQAYIKTTSGNSVTATISGTSVSGSSITGTPSATVVGNNTWQSVTLNASHYVTTNSGPLGGWFPSINAADVQADGAYCTVSGYVYILGGSDAGHNKLATVNYSSTGNPGLKGWFPTAPLPFATSASAAASYGNHIYTGAGLITVSGTQFVTNAMYHGVAQSNGSIPSWTQVNTFATPRYYHSMTTYSGYVYAGGGFTVSGGAVVPTTNFSYAKMNSDGSLTTWSGTTSYPTVNALGSLVAYNGYMYRVGGVTDTSDTPTASVSYAPINSNGTIGAWTATTSLPQAVWGGSVQAYNGYMYVIGGATAAAYLTTIYYAVINSNGTLGTWNSTTSFNQPRSQAATVIANNYLYIIGGYYQATGGATHQYLTDSQYALFGTTGVFLKFTSGNTFNLDTVTTDITMPYYDGSSGDTTLTSYDWVGTTNLSRSTATSIPQTYTYEVSFSGPVASLDTPVANAVSGSSYTANSKADGTGTDMTPFIVVESISFGGTQGFITFSNTSSNQAYITSLTLYGVPALTTNTITQSYKDASSIAQYKLNPANSGAILSISNPLIQTVDTAKGLAYSLVNNYAAPNRSISTTNFSAPQLQFGDLVSFHNLKTGETHNLFIVGIENSLSIANDNPAFTQKLTLEERKVAHYFTIGSSTIGSADSIAP